jgi:hypothetical protein
MLSHRTSILAFFASWLILNLSTGLVDANIQVRDEDNNEGNRRASRRFLSRRNPNQRTLRGLQAPPQPNQDMLDLIALYNPEVLDASGKIILTSPTNPFIASTSTSGKGKGGDGKGKSSGKNKSAAPSAIPTASPTPFPTIVTPTVSQSPTFEPSAGPSNEPSASFAPSMASKKGGKKGGKGGGKGKDTRRQMFTSTVVFNDR